jgi:hypothetical protein
MVHIWRAVFCLVATATVLIACGDSAPRDDPVAKRSTAVASPEPYRIVGLPFVGGSPSHLWVFVRLNRELPQTKIQDG